MITYPYLKEGAAIGVTAPSSGVSPQLHELLKRSRQRMEEQGYNVQFGDTVWTQDKAKSAPATIRAAEFNRMMSDSKIDIIIPPWGGELLIEILEAVDFEELKLPVVYDIDCGHVPPQLTLINGAYAEVEVLASSGTGTVKQTFKP
ncbi:LD-carboxypeptidase [Paenibacillus pinihumi]|uniref:LD-carboxypeptidase n=1 Tax=Paenibacillus pinihumi TaxID=669462 RepID=UPI00041ACD39|nr:LD-carboxypeptidase [Paenibacillus pinihumi]